MPVVPSQTTIMDALKTTDMGWKFWADELGTHVPTLSQWAHGVRPMPEDRRLAALVALGTHRPDVAAEVWREFLRPLGLTVAPVRVSPSTNTRLTGGVLQRETAHVAIARAEADEDGVRDAAEIRRELREAKEAREAAEQHEAALAQELMAAEESAAQRPLGFGRGGELVNK